jgi:ComF family protein
MRAAVHLMKFEGVPALAKPLSELLARSILSLREDVPGSMAVIPVPLFRGKRKFNQSTLLARHALKLVEAERPDWALALLPHVLRRVRRTESQFLLTPVQRRENVRGAFRVDADLAGVDVLLIDDVYTTGATVRECTRVLLAAGAASVRVATLARAVREVSVERWEAPVIPANALASEALLAAGA